MGEVGEVSRPACLVCGRAKDQVKRAIGGGGRDMAHGSESAACPGCSSPACRPAVYVSFSDLSDCLVRQEKVWPSPPGVVTNLDALAELGQPVANGGVDAGAEQQHADGEGEEERPGPYPARSCGRHDILI